MKILYIYLGTSVDVYNMDVIHHLEIDRDQTKISVFFKDTSKQFKMADVIYSFYKWEIK